MSMHLSKRFHQIVPHYATHDIECIKLMKNFRYSDDVTHMKLIDSPIQDFTYIMGKKYGPINVKPLFKNMPRVHIITRGFHSFQSLKYALWFKNNTFYYPPCKVCKCIIPKGSWYYDGFVEYTNSKGYVSDSIIIKEIMEE